MNEARTRISQVFVDDYEVTGQRSAGEKGNTTEKTNLEDSDGQRTSFQGPKGKCVRVDRREQWIGGSCSETVKGDETFRKQTATYTKTEKLQTLIREENEGKINGKQRNRVVKRGKRRPR